MLRVLDKTKAVIDLPGLGMAPETYSRYSDLIRSPYGMVICAGPTGSGKTTTLYATFTAINNEDINVVTVEDPVEYVFPKINQIQINEAGGLTFANGLRAILRQDPDAILVGEIRDVETARIAVQAALTGHFVMSSLHATDATSALHRFMDMGIEPFLVASSLLGVVGQRLVRKICPNCTTHYEPTPDERAFYERGGGDPTKTKFVHGAGCSFCGQTGYYDRVGIYEVLAVTDEFKELIVQNAPHAELRRARDRTRNAHAARAGRPARDAGQDHHRRGASHRVRPLGRRKTQDAHLQVRRRPVADGVQVKETAEAPSEDVLRNQLLLRNLEVQQLKQRSRLQRARAHAAARTEAGDHALLPPDGGVRAHRYPDHRRARSDRGRLGQQALQADARRDARADPERPPFSDALAEHASVFPPYYVGILQSSELTGQLDTSLEQLSGYIERDVEAKSKVKSALVYPLVVLGMSIVTVVDPRRLRAAEVHQVLQEPRRQAAAADAHAARVLRRDAEVLVRVGRAVRRRSSRSAFGCTRSEQGRLVRDKMFLRLPLIKDIVLYAVVERVCRIIAAMVKAGVPLPDTLAAAIQGTNNKVFEAALLGAQERMLEGEGSRAPITDSGRCFRRPRRR